MFSRENDISSIKIIDFGLSLQNFDSLCNSDYFAFAVSAQEGFEAFLKWTVQV